jgi:hypothetical protein
MFDLILITLGGEQVTFDCIDTGSVACGLARLASRTERYSRIEVRRSNELFWSWPQRPSALFSASAPNPGE